MEYKSLQIRKRYNKIYNMNSVNYELLNALIIIGIIAFIVFILAMIYFIVVFTKINIIAKKTDYLIEDATYKSEKLNVTVDAIVKISNYFNVLDTYFNNSNDEVITFVKQKLTALLDKKPTKSFINPKKSSSTKKDDSLDKPTNAE